MTPSAEHKRQTVEGALKHAGIAYCDNDGHWHYALPVRDKGESFPKYGFMILPEALAKERIAQKKYTLFFLTREQVRGLEDRWSASLTNTIENTETFTESSSEERLRLQQLEADWLSFSEWRDIVEKRLGELNAHTQENRIRLIDVKERVTTVEGEISTAQSQLLYVKQTVSAQGEQQERHHETLDKLARNMTDFSEQRRFTYISKPYFQPRESLWKMLER